MKADCKGKTCKVREIALEGKMSRDAIRQILAANLLQKIVGQNLAYCVSAPLLKNHFFSI